MYLRTPAWNFSGVTRRSNIAITEAPFWYVMASNAFTMSSFDLIGSRIRRAVTSASAAMATLRTETRCSSMFHSRRQGSITFVVIQVAKASLSQMSSHQAW